MTVLAEEKIILTYRYRPDRYDDLYFKLFTSLIFLFNTAELASHINCSPFNFENSEAMTRTERQK